MMWKPLVHDSLSDRCRESAREVLCKLDEVDGYGIGVASGLAGIGMAEAYISRALGIEVGPGRGRDRVLRAEDLASSVDLGAGLFSGVSGLAFASTYVDRLLQVGESGIDLHDIDRALRVYLSRESGPKCGLDIISGVAGIGVFATSRYMETGDSGLAQVCLGAVQREVARVGWPPMRSVRDGVRCIDLGMAHGVPGLIVFLGGAARSGLLSEREESLLRDLCVWLLLQRSPIDSGLQFPFRVGDARGGRYPRSSRLAWCYGDLGVALALVAAGRGLNDSELVGEGVEIAIRASGVDPMVGGVMDHGLCHGASGVVMALAVVACVSNSNELERAVQEWVRLLLDSRVQDSALGGYTSWSPGKRDIGQRPTEWFADPGFLVGAAGVAALLAAVVSDEAPDWMTLFGAV